MNTYNLIKIAIEDRLQVVATYDGLVRLFCPHALGVKRDVPHALVYQFEGASKSGLPPTGEWRCLNVDDLADVSLQPGEWHSAANVFNPQSCMDRIDVSVQPFPPLVSVEPCEPAAEHPGEA
ncbi:MAG: hypothetical protein ACRDJH_11445 [Thermomicrobiales bacterium]